jgi:LuxR family maltose regulon positive regulatory protein
MGAEPLLLSKLQLPPSRRGAVARPELVARLGAATQLPLTVVVAPAGYGKTTLLSLWLEKRAAGGDGRVAWLSLDADDDHAPRFLRYLAAALGRFCPQAETEARALLESPEQLSPAVVVAVLLNRLREQEAAGLLVLDDYHLVTAGPIHEALTLLIDRLPPHLHLVIASRTDPPLPLARWRARGQLLEVRQADLQFSAGETAAFLSRTMGLRLPVAAVARLRDRTEGWAAGLQLAALSLQRAADPAAWIASLGGDERAIAAFLLDEVWARLPPEVRDFLLRTAPLARFNAALADAVAPGGDGVAMLARLDAANLFLVPLDQRGEWYRYHHLFATFLQAQARQFLPAAERAAIHRRAGLSFEQLGSPAEAIEHALAGGDEMRAVRLIRLVATSYMKRADLLPLQDWLARLPASTRYRCLGLALNYTWTLLLTGQLDAADRQLDGVEAYLADDPAQDTAQTRGEVATLRTSVARYRGDVAGTIAFARAALEQIPADEQIHRSMTLLNLSTAHLQSGHPLLAEPALLEAHCLSKAGDHSYLQLGVLEALGELRRVQGRLHDAARVYATIAALAGQNVAFRRIGGVGRGEVLLEGLDLDGAAAAFQEWLSFGTAGAGAVTGVRALLGLVRAGWLRADFALARRSLRQAEELACACPEPHPGDLVAACRAELALRAGDLPAAARWARRYERASDAPGRAMDYPAESETQTLALVWLAERRFQAALDLLSPLRAAAERDGRHHSLLLLQIQVAVALHGLRQGTALEVFGQALALAEPEGYLRPFVEERRLVVPLLQQALVAGIAPAWTRHLLAACRQAAAAARAPESLSAREREILHLLARGCANREIAARLGVAASTIGWHIKNIYGKLAAHNRTEAVARARELHLLSS